MVHKRRGGRDVFRDGQLACNGDFDLNCMSRYTRLKFIRLVFFIILTQ